MSMLFESKYGKPSLFMYASWICDVQFDKYLVKDVSIPIGLDKELTQKAVSH
jgi:hypothetical protein